MLTIAKLIYSAITSLDGYIEDEDGTFDWAEPDEEMHAFVNDSNGRLVPTFTGDGCTKRGSIGRPCTPAPGAQLSAPWSPDFSAFYGPFVMNTREEIRQAIDDYQSGRLGTIPADQLAPRDFA